ncbi:hypothetical protein DYI37_03305 [Fulvimarina endophytica]|uniref:Uncharacterized protein n=1 Tax=Fulvimarina endophytica TaxID=2293836 RepID=A0A371XB71_9HYPH|nr:hypothetical protein [Fulvimarina endophytica]RFC66483.1 hypothetical protein DYI37_03305 [Fulvimarina endophytica]
MMTIEEAAKEAVDALQYLRPSAVSNVAHLAQSCGFQHPRSVVTAHRKAGPQLSRNEKREAGIRANGFMSQSAYEELTDAGKAKPMEAHYHTVMRAFFTHNRAREIERSSSSPYASASYRSTFPDCRGCARLDGTEAETPTPPPDCDYEWCPLGIRYSFDFLGEVVDNANARREAMVDGVLRGDYEDFRLRCTACSHPLVVAVDEISADTPVSCERCGHVFSTYGVLREAVTGEVKKRLDDALQASERLVDTSSISKPEP